MSLITCQITKLGRESAERTLKCSSLVYALWHCRQMNGLMEGWPVESDITAYAGNAFSLTGDTVERG